MSAEQISEVLLHVASYAGAPRGIAAFRAAKEVIDELRDTNAQV